MTMKDVPDAAPMTMKYNARNLMTLMQDGNLLAAPNNWLATNHDIYGRPTSTGLVINTASPDPNSNFTFTAPNQLTSTTYDDVAGIDVIKKGKVSQTKVRVLDGGTADITTNFTYDAHGRLSGTTANNFLPAPTTGSDTYVFTYDWADNRLTSTRTHKRLSTDAATTILETTTYDHAGRATNNRHKLNADPEKTVSNLVYNYKDQLVEKNLGYTSATSTLQSLDYAYNDQGWLTAINQAVLVPSTLIGGVVAPLAACPTAPAVPNPGLGTVPDDNDLFYLELKYDNLFSGMSGTIQKNGNIAQMQWRTRGRERQGYSFGYDTYDRLTAASYYDINDAGTATASGRYNENLAYDKRGNINTLQRQGAQLSGSCWNFAQIDNLTYAYAPNTNKLSGISDAASATYKAKGFNPGAGSGSYAYDLNGNLTGDPYKSMTIAYNHLNLPKLFTFASGAQSNTIDILYDAAGTKLRKTVKAGPTAIYTQDYLSGIEYRDGAREAIYTAEGRVKYTSPTTTRYEYSIKDHLGNTRISFCDLNNNGVVNVTTTPATNEILQENHYYPFGLNMDGPWMNDAALDNKYQYNGKEFNDDFGLNLNDYGARWYDASVGRWWSIDPSLEKYYSSSPFNYAANNPILLIDINGKEWVNPYTQEVADLSKKLENASSKKEIRQTKRALNTAKSNESLVNTYLDNLKSNDPALYNYVDNLKVSSNNGKEANVKVNVKIGNGTSGNNGQAAETAYSCSNPDGVPNVMYNGQGIVAPLRPGTSQVGFDITLQRITSFSDSDLANEAGDVMYYMEYNSEAVKEGGDEKAYKKGGLNAYLLKGARNYSQAVQDKYNERKANGEGKNPNNNPYPLPLAKKD